MGLKIIWKRRHVCGPWSVVKSSLAIVVVCSAALHTPYAGPPDGYIEKRVEKRAVIPADLARIREISWGRVEGRAQQREIKSGYWRMESAD